MHFRALFVLAASVATAAPALSQSGSVTIDYVIVVDVSGSMKGDGGTPNIFPQVKAQLRTLIGQLDDQQSVLIQPFAESLRPPRRFDLSTQRQQALDYIESLKADGTRTFIYSSLLAAYDEYNRFRGTRNDRVAAVFVYTDGRDESGRTMREIVEDLKLKRQTYDYLYYATLGRDLDPADAAALESSGFATYDPAPEGEVHTPVIVEVRYPLLDFGNLRTDSLRTQEQRFDVRGTLPPGFRLDTRMVVPDLTVQAVYAEVVPEQLRPSGRVPLRIALRNARDDVRRQRYEGVIELRKSDPAVLVIPQTIATRFRYAPRQFVEVLAENERRPELRLGELDPFRAEARRDSVSDAIPLRYDGITRREGGTFRVRVEENPRNPDRLPPGTLRLNGRPGAEHRLDARGTRELELTAAAEADGLTPGTYEGILVVDSDALEIEGRDTIPWRVEVPGKPWAWYVLPGLGLLVLLLAGVSYWVSRPRLRGRLVLDADDRSIYLGDQTRVFIGPDATTVPTPEDSVVQIEARWQSGVTAVSNGSATFTRDDVVADQPFYEEALQEGDVLAIGEYRLRYTET
jgi:hypothetical protein